MANAEFVQKVYLARHGERADFSDISWYPEENSKQPSNMPPDPQLTIRGMMQSRDLGRHLSSNKDIHEIYTSPFVRAVQTSQFACEEIEGTEDKVRVELGLAECLSSELNWGESVNPLGKIVPPKLLKKSLGSKVDGNYQSLVSPNFPESLPTMAERCQLLISSLLDVAREGPLVMVTHSSVIEAITAALIPGTRFPRGITYCSLTELEVVRNVESGEVVDAKAVRLADDTFVKCKAEYELCNSGFRFAKKPFPPLLLFGDCCVVEEDEYEEMVISLPAESLDVEEGVDYEYNGEGTPCGITTQGSMAINQGLVTPLHQPVAPKKKVEKEKQEFLAFADSSGRIPMEKAVFMAHYRGLAPSKEDVRSFKEKHGGHMDYPTYLKFLHSIKHSDDTPDELTSCFEVYDPRKTGTVSRLNFEVLLGLYGDKLSAKEMNQICEQFQLGDSNKIDYRAFVHSLMESPNLPEIDFGPDQYEDGSPVHRRLPSKVEPVEEATPVVKKRPNELEEAFLSLASSKEEQLPIDKAAEKIERLGVPFYPKDIGDFQAAHGDATTVDYNGFVEMVEFINKRHTAFNDVAGPKKSITTEQAGQLVSQFGLKSPPANQDMTQFAVKNGKELDYQQFMSFCQFTEQRQMAFAALAVEGNTNQISADKAGVLANKFGFAPSVDDIRQLQQSSPLLDYQSFMNFLDTCAHTEDQDVKGMQEFFKPYDTKGTGYVSQKVFRNLLYMFGESYQPEQIDVIVRDICGNADPINYMTFINKVLTVPTDEIAVDPLAGVMGGRSSSRSQLQVVGEESQEDEEEAK